MAESLIKTTLRMTKKQKVGVKKAAKAEGVYEADWVRDAVDRKLAKARA